MKDKFIGVFDSGIGGLTVVKSIVEKMPHENIVYFGDTAHVPYGTRTRNQITELVMNDVRFLSRFDLKAVVIACNTADCAAKDEVEKYCDVPVFGTIEPTAEIAASAINNGKIGVIATNATVNSGAYERAIKRFNQNAQVVSAACPLLVPLVESGKFHKGDAEAEKALAGYLLPLKEQGIDTLILGCTHYPMLSDIIAGIIPDIKLISSSASAADALKNALEKDGLKKESGNSVKKYFVSGNPEEFEKFAGIFMGDTGVMAEHADV